jgi:hypothetical protein
LRKGIVGVGVGVGVGEGEGKSWKVRVEMRWCGMRAETVVRILVQHDFGVIGRTITDRRNSKIRICVSTSQIALRTTQKKGHFANHDFYSLIPNI